MVALKIYAGQNILVGLFFKRTAAYIDTTHRVDKISILVKIAQSQRLDRCQNTPLA